MLQLSIVIPYFNNSSTIDKLLNSIDKFQDYSKYEVIIIDDKSNYEQFEFLLSMEQKFNFKLSIYKNDTDFKGPGPVKNIGIKKSIGKWITFIDSDDEFTDDFYESFSLNFDSYKDMIFYKLISYTENNEIGVRHVSFENQIINYLNKSTEEDLRYNYNLATGRLFNREFLLKNNIFFNNQMLGEDFYFSVKTGIHAKDFEVIDKYVYRWNYNKISLTSSMSKEKFIQSINSTIETNKIIKEFNPRIKIKKSVLKYVAFSLIRYKLGIVFTIRLAITLMHNGIPFFNSNDLLSLKNFFDNNKYYKKT